jgi:hypothetical protein
MANFIEVVGWTGAALVLLGYALVSTGRIRAQSWTYQGLNISGAFGLVVNSWWYGAIPSVVVNVIWMGIGFYALRQRGRA